MDSLFHFCCRKLVVLCFVLVLICGCVLSAGLDVHRLRKDETTRRILMDSEKQVKKVKINGGNQTKLVMSGSSKNQTKIKPSLSKNLTKLAKPTSSLLKLKSNGESLKKTDLKKINSTSLSKKLSNSTLSKKSLDLIKLAKSSSVKELPSLSDKNLLSEPKTPKSGKSAEQKQKSKPVKPPYWLTDDDDTDLVAEFRDLPNKLQKSLLPDIERISMTSKKYLTRANKEMTRGIKPIVGKKYAPTIASFVSFSFIIIPLILVSLLVNRIKSYFSLQKVLIFIQIYLAIYFSILCLSSIVTGLDPLKFFFATSTSTYLCVMVLQTLAYVLYLLMLLMYLILVFSTESTLACKMFGLGQTLIGFAVGLHFYMAVFHRVVLHQPPKTSWKIHGAYAACFLFVCALAAAEKRKKIYMEEDGEEGKKN